MECEHVGTKTTEREATSHEKPVHVRNIFERHLVRKKEYQKREGKKQRRKTFKATERKQIALQNTKGNREKKITWCRASIYISLKDYIKLIFKNFIAEYACNKHPMGNGNL